MCINTLIMKVETKFNCSLFSVLYLTDHKEFGCSFSSVSLCRWELSVKSLLWCYIPKELFVPITLFHVYCCSWATLWCFKALLMVLLSATLLPSWPIFIPFHCFKLCFRLDLKVKEEMVWWWLMLKINGGFWQPDLLNIHLYFVLVHLPFAVLQSQLLPHCFCT